MKLLCCLLLLLTWSCAERANGSSKIEEERQTDQSLGPERPLQFPLDLSLTGSIRGTVYYRGTVPKPEPVYQMAGFAECIRLHKNTPPAETYMIQNERLQNVLVYIRDREFGAATFPIPTQPAILDQIGCIYKPHVLGLQVGQKLILRNSDGFLHNVKADTKRNTSFNVNMPRKGDQEVVFERAEIFPLHCDIHAWMNCHVGVFSHPYFAVTDAQGNFHIENLPAGKYTLNAWHESPDLERQEKIIEIKAREDLAMEFSFP